MILYIFFLLVSYCCCCCCYVASVVSDSVRPYRRQPSWLPSRWDSPGKNTGVGCHFLLQRMKVKSESEVAQSYPTLSDPRTAAYQAPLSMGFSRQEYWIGLPLPSPDMCDVLPTREALSSFTLQFLLGSHCINVGCSVGSDSL